ncbi:unnamed protein product [Rotaria socialis]|uniref:tRNA (guanine(37)-N1)-methyltransferase n=1 Tax=Rotaria socialis TaxID=392032 RepID=A0A820TV41_9BILA|nr:unnamed protein product [Rotaria socialis]CAF4476576.1 unnamed protein product [Rotaria socialis]
MDISCPQCQTTKYRNPKMKLMVSKCGHSLCENCVEFKFSKGVGYCPTCKTELKKSGFRYQIFEDAFVELEVDIRKRILKDFNRKEQDFDSLDAYNDYLELLETYIFNLTNKVDVEETERKIAEYKEANKDIINKNRGKLTNDEIFIEHLIEQERTAEEMRKKVYEQELQKEQEAKQRVKNDLMEALLQTDGNVDQVLRRGIEDLEKKRKEDVQPIMPNMINREEDILISLTSDQNQQRLFEYIPPVYEHQGPPVPEKNDLEQLGYLDHVRQERPVERAGGYTREYPCLRAIQEAFDMLLFVKEKSLINVKQELTQENEPMEIPPSVKGMTELNRDEFTQTITVPYINIPGECMQSKQLKDILLILPSFKNARDLEPRLKQISLDPDVIQTKEDIIKRVPSIEEYVEQSFGFIQIIITYTNYTIEQIIKGILPDDLMKDKNVNNGSGYSLIGHIAHFNLRDEVLPYKHIIAQVVLDKLPHVKTVVNKLHEIDSVYRNFELEILAGDPNTIVKCRESKVTFEFDFAKVYWNPRLSTEHERIIEFLRPNDLVFDVCAGVGPFVVPASKFGCLVYANDINPECFKWMNVNFKRNQPKNALREYHLFNLDGREFLRTIALPQIEHYQKQGQLNRNIVILMNLPGLAITFLDVISEWLSINIEEKQQWKLPIHIYCYTFSRGEDRVEDVRTRLNLILPNVDNDQVSYRFVRQVAPNKDMMCVHIRLYDKKVEDDKRQNCSE